MRFEFFLLREKDRHLVAQILKFATELPRAAYNGTGRAFAMHAGLLDSFETHDCDCDTHLRLIAL
jgi:hypothetical protein